MIDDRQLGLDILDTLSSLDSKPLDVAGLLSALRTDLVSLCNLGLDFEHNTSDRSKMSDHRSIRVDQNQSCTEIYNVLALSVSFGWPSYRLGKRPQHSSGGLQSWFFQWHC